MLDFTKWHRRREGYNTVPVAKIKVEFISILAQAQKMAGIGAMEQGLAVIVSAVGGLPDIVKHGDNGLLIEPRRADQLRATGRRSQPGQLQATEPASRFGQRPLARASSSSSSASKTPCSCCTWCPISWAMTYACAKSPGAWPRRPSP